MAYGDIVQEDIVISKDGGDDEFFDTIEEADIRLSEIKTKNEPWSQYYLKQWVEDENGVPQEGDVTLFSEFVGSGINKEEDLSNNDLDATQKMPQ